MSEIKSYGFRLPYDPARRTTMLLLLVVTAMFGFGFAAKPLYDAFCRVTGFGGTVREDVEIPSTMLDREMLVRFDASMASELLSFRAPPTQLVLRLGEVGMAFYEVSNLSDKPVTAIASYNVVPHKAGRFFGKVDCFCFEERVFKPGQTMRLPVTFFIDPQMDQDNQLDDVSLITLSYTMHTSS